LRFPRTTRLVGLHGLFSLCTEFRTPLQLFHGPPPEVLGAGTNDAIGLSAHYTILSQPDLRGTPAPPGWSIGNGIYGRANRWPVKSSRHPMRPISDVSS
jgi:hypothetical protein